MNETSRSGAVLPAEQARRVDVVCTRFEVAWQGSAPPRIEDFLTDTPERPVLLRELVLLDVYHRGQRGEACQPRDYYPRFSELDPTWLAQALATCTNSGAPAATVPDARFLTPPGTPPTAGVPAVAGYEVLEVLGHGSMGVVYKARQDKLNRIVALKMILAGGHAGPEELSRFRREAEAVAQLQHPNIVQIHEIGEQDGRPFFALEYVDGGNLAQQLAGTPRPALEAARLMETLARAIHHAHQRGIVHRDLKPANILLSPLPPGERGRGLGGPALPRSPTSAWPSAWRAARARP